MGRLAALKLQFGRANVEWVRGPTLGKPCSPNPLDQVRLIYSTILLKSSTIFIRMIIIGRCIAQTVGSKYGDHCRSFDYTTFENGKYGYSGNCIGISGVSSSLLIPKMIHK